MEELNLCIIKPNKSAFSETFIQEHINRLPGNKKVLYGGAFPVYDHQDRFLISSVLGMISFLIQKRLFNKLNIGVRTRALSKYLIRTKIDVVLAEYGIVGAMVTEACRMANVPLVVHFHGADAHHKGTIEKYITLYGKMFNYANTIVAVSNEMVDALKRMGAPADKILLNPYGVNTALFKQVDVASSKPNFLSVGRFVEKKSPSSVVRAFHQLIQKQPNARLWMVGDGALLQPTKQLVEQLNLADKVEFTGVLKTNEVQQLMQQMRCFVQHSVTAADGDMEGTPNTILEAGACGLAIVSTQHAGIKEAVINGETGYLVPEHDVEGMANYMIKIAEDVDLAADLGAKEAAHIRQNYDVRDRIKTLTAALESAIKHKK
ncbi:glycosyltransferase [Mucilaginibacter auburnensis]|uniref:Glycosyltransferase involved in cell wall biosynthesis n=1 Tax=Mucilaginibacter auburnensis TaxID=1457233 RepID=A0A2H9VSH5_9SPHI|nr:glycosyltransferase [Mucilaginibacter auburnensis]PJJ83770.1 glycosyltransferase involved in cell wall biosynthesis [Mucilaginibacter auburnensis]